ncbi:MAG: cytidylyltransferase domain-containing protein, partial [Candidatus Heimdallarchaeaceae archaeon]
IPRKNVRFLHNKPLIAYSILSAKKSRYIDRVIVTTDDDEIKEIAYIYGADAVIDRPKQLADDTTTLDPVVFHAYNTYCSSAKEQFDIVVTLQPTSPLLRISSIDGAIEKFVLTNLNTVISVKPVRHLFWIAKDRSLIPFYPKRLNRQQLNPIYFETGGFLISNAKLITSEKRIFDPIGVFELSEDEALDIDSPVDWKIAETLMKKLKILIRVDGNHSIGMGHIYRMITIANKLTEHDILFVLNSNSDLGIKKVSHYNYRYTTISEEREFFEKIQLERPNIILLDILDTEENYVKEIKKFNTFVVSFEDLGSGAKYADIVINALYKEVSGNNENTYSGHEYVCLRDEFYLFPRKIISEKVEKILITFGGIDQKNLTITSLKAIEKLGLKDISVVVIVGLGYRSWEELESCIAKMNDEGFKIELHKDVKFISKYMFDADIAITSNGRTVYEIASFGVPCISIAQNTRETTHTFAINNEGIRYLGIAKEGISEVLTKELKSLIEDCEQRKRMNQVLLRFDLRKGLKRVISLILEKYEEKFQEEILT